VKRIIATLVPITCLFACATAVAAPETPGVALVSEGSVYPSDGYATFTSVHATQTTITANVLADDETVIFDSPMTLMLPGPVDEAIYAVDATGIPGDTGPAPKEGPEQQCGYGVIGHTSCDVSGACFVVVSGNLERDNITVRYQAPARNADYPPAPCGFTVNGDRGNDTIDSRDGVWSHVICGGGVDHVRADVGDVVDPGCEAVTRG
jgi:hypothetical protein